MRVLGAARYAINTSRGLRRDDIMLERASYTQRLVFGVARHERTKLVLRRQSIPLVGAAKRNAGYTPTVLALIGEIVGENRLMRAVKAANRDARCGETYASGDSGEPQRCAAAAQCVLRESGHYGSDAQ